MKIFIDYKMMGRNNYPLLLEKFKSIEFVNDFNGNEDIDAMVVMNATIKNLDFSRFKKLKWVQLLMAGYDNVNVDALKANGVMVCNAQDIFSTSIAEDVFSKILYFNRNTNHYVDSKRAKIWEPIRKEPEIFNSVVSILGTGSIGQEVAKRMKAFGAKKIYGYKRSLSQVPFFDEVVCDLAGLVRIIKAADYLIIALPLTEDTYHLIDADKLSFMKDDALLINVARGDIIDQKALIDALKSKKIRGAGLDVTSPEPLPQNNELWVLDNVFITPHNASSSPYMKDRLYEMTKENIQLFINGQKPKYQL
jgi:phosphoglycerate dehydrogenase-like enzyme